jgi:hypothetical protein
MKTTIITLAMLLAVACGVQPTKNNQDIGEIKPIEQIDKELVELILAIEKNSDYWGPNMDDVKAFTNALERYLRYPQTYSNDMPLLSEKMHIKKFPISGNKLYSYGWNEGGTMGYRHNTYIQYRNEDGDIEYVPFLNDLRYPSSFNLQEFCYDNTIYYLVKQYSRGMSCSWYYYIAIISIKDGAITYHPEFFPEELNFKPGTEEYFIYDESGKIIDNSERPSYFMSVCGTENANTNVGFDFDPETLTIKVRDDADWTESRTGAVVEREWRLNIAK